MNPELLTIISGIVLIAVIAVAGWATRRRRTGEGGDESGDERAVTKDP